jgi:hypothetical protein
MDALDAVRREMHKEREASRRKAQDVYNRRMKLVWELVPWHNMASAPAPSEHGVDAMAD